MSKTNIVQDVMDVFRAAGFEVRVSEFGNKPETIIYGTADNAGILMESVCEHFGISTEVAFSCAQRQDKDSGAPLTAPAPLTEWQMVPVEPTPQMIAAMHFKGDIDIAIGHAQFYKDAEDDYAAMLAAAPKAEEAFAWAAFAESGNTIIWSRNRSEVEPIAARYGRPVVPVIALSCAKAAPAAPGQAWIAADLDPAEPVYRVSDVAAPVQTAVQGDLTDEAIDEVWRAMPGGVDGWLKQFGYRQFARSIARYTLVRVAASMAGTIRPTDDELWEQTIGERDHYHEWADKLADAIAKHFGAEIGEHSNMNCPWAEALEVIVAAPVQAEQAQAEPVPQSVLDTLWQRVTDAREAAYTFGDTCKEAVEIALDGVLDMLVQADLALPAQAEQAAAVRAAEWISVEDERKPVGRSVILVAVDYVRYGEYEDGTPGEHRGYVVAEGEYVPKHGESGNYFTCFSSPHGDSESITHWMPLPAAPSTATSNDTGALGEKGAEA